MQKNPIFKRSPIWSLELKSIPFRLGKYARFWQRLASYNLGSLEVIKPAKCVRSSILSTHVAPWGVILNLVAPCHMPQEPNYLAVGGILSVADDQPSCTFPGWPENLSKCCSGLSPFKLLHVKLSGHSIRVLLVQNTGWKKPMPLIFGAELSHCLDKN